MIVVVEAGVNCSPIASMICKLVDLSMDLEVYKLVDNSVDFVMRKLVDNFELGQNNLFEAL